MSKHRYNVCVCIMSLILFHSHFGSRMSLIAGESSGAEESCVAGDSSDSAQRPSRVPKLKGIAGTFF